MPTKKHPTQTTHKPVTSLAMSMLAISSPLWAQAPAVETAAKETKSQTSVSAEKTLKPVTVKDSASREAIGYNPAVSNVGRTNQALRDIPNSVTVVPEQLMHDRGADNFKEALRNVAGLTFNAGEGGRIGDNITLRGFSVVGDVYLDNIRDIAQYNRETFNLESIDVLRGSASMLYGRGSAGGLINQVSKTPHRFGGKEITATLGSNGYKRLSTDLTHALSNTTVMRLNALTHDADSFRDSVNNKRQALAPTVVFGLGTPDQITLAHYYLKENNLPDYGVPYFRKPGDLEATPLDVPVNTFYGLANADYERNSASITTATYQHRFDASSLLKTSVRTAKYARDLWVTAPRLAAGTTAINANTVVNRGRPARGGEERAITSQTDYTDKLKLAGMAHEVLAGLELARERSKRWSNTGAVTNPPTTAFNPNPAPTLAANYFSSQGRINPNSFVSTTRGLYAQTTSAITAQWKLVAGLRHDHFVSDYERTAPLTPLSRTDNVWSKKVGAIYQPTDAVSLYSSWGTSFNPSGELYQLDPAGSNTPPELNRNIELGAKWDLFDGQLALRAAAYRTEKTNERNTDVASPTLFLLSGKRRTQGVEFEAAGRINANWEVFTAFAFQQGRITQASGQQAGTQDKTPINTPNYTASLWSTFKASDRLKLGGGVEGVGKRFGNSTNTSALPAYERVDAMAEYTVGQVAWQINIKNLLNRDYYEGVYAGHTVPGTKRATTIAATYKF